MVVKKKMLKVLQLCSFCSGEACKLTLKMLVNIHFPNGGGPYPPAPLSRGNAPRNRPGPQRPLDPSLLFSHFTSEQFHPCVVCAGVIAGGGRIDKPMLKAGRAYHKYMTIM